MSSGRSVNIDFHAHVIPPAYLDLARAGRVPELRVERTAGGEVLDVIGGSVDLRKKIGSMLLVTPGIRLAGGAADDQKRIVTPKDAIAAGADHLVVGRPVLVARDPKAAAEAIVAEIASALQ